MKSTKTQFLTSAAINAKSPLWLIYTFRATFVITTVLSLWINETSLINELYKSEIMLCLKCLDLAVWGISKGAGVVEK